MPQARFAWIARLLCALALAACSEPGTPPPEQPAAPAAEPTAHAATSVWPGMPASFEPLVLPSSPDGCDGRTVFIDASTLTVEPPLATRGAPSDASPPGIEREMASLLGAMDLLAMMQGAYNGPPGELHLRWLLSQESLVLVFDRGVPAGRFLSALRGAREQSSIVRLGGIDALGQRACATAFLVAELPAACSGRATTDGALSIDSPAIDGPSTRIDASTPAGLLPGERDEGLHLVAMDTHGEAPSAIVSAIALARWTERRYPLISPMLPRGTPL